jgi:spore maturation protein CgeB
MSGRLNVAFFGSSLVSAYWNGAATYYRGLLRSLSELGYDITFYEPDAYERQAHRDIEDPPWAKVVVYSGTSEDAARRALDDARGADLIVKASGVGVFDALLEAGVISLRNARNLVAFWDVDAPATLERVQTDLSDPFRALIPQYDVVFTYGGGEPVISAYRALGAQRCVPIYNALDATTHHPVPAEPRFLADLSLCANRLPDREARVEQFFLKAAEALPERTFLLGGSGWGDRPLPTNVRYVGHVYTRDHNAFNCTPLAVLNVTRDSMTRFGFSPATRVFEVAGAGACLISDAWEGMELFLEPGKEVLLARHGDEVAEQLAKLTPERARAIGEAGRRRILAHHTYEQRAKEVDAVVRGLGARSEASELAGDRATQPVEARSYTRERTEAQP